MMRRQVIYIVCICALAVGCVKPSPVKATRVDGITQTLMHEQSEFTFIVNGTGQLHIETHSYGFDGDHDPVIVRDVLDGAQQFITYTCADVWNGKTIPCHDVPVGFIRWTVPRGKSLTIHLKDNGLINGAGFRRKTSPGHYRNGQIVEVE